jgi:hypothetical protein
VTATDAARPAGASLDQLLIANAAPFRGGARWLWGGIAAGVIGTAGLVVGAWVNVTQVFFSWLIAYTFALTIVIGMAAFLMACHTMGATWPTAIRRLGEAIIAAMPLLAVMVIPLLLGLSHLYPWMHPGAISDAQTRELVRHKLPLMNRPLVLVRSVAYITVWLIVCSGLRGFSLAMDGPRGRDRTARLQAFSAVLLPALAISGSWAAFDWVMSLSPDWYSTMFGLYVLAGGFLGALALLVILTVYADTTGRLRGLRASHHYALGRLLLSFTVFWAYVAYFQFFLIWIADKPIEARWYLDRVHGGHAWVSGFLVFGQFLVPFFALLPYAIKRRERGLMIIGWWLLGAHYVDVHWLIAPARGATAPIVHWLDAAALLCVGGFTVAFAVWRQRGYPLAATSDPRYARALQYHSK